MAGCFDLLKLATNCLVILCYVHFLMFLSVAISVVNSLYVRM